MTLQMAERAGAKASARCSLRAAGAVKLNRFVVASHTVQQTRLPIATVGAAFGARPEIGPEFEQRGLPRFGLGPCLDLLAAQFAQAPPAKGMAIDTEDVGLRHVTRPRRMRPQPSARHAENRRRAARRMRR